MEIIEGVVTQEFNEGMLSNIDLPTDEANGVYYDTLEQRLSKYVGKKVRVTIEEIE